MRRFAAAPALALLLVGCQVQLRTNAPIEAAAAPSPSTQRPLEAPFEPAQAPSSCAEPLRDLAQASQLMADRLVAIREPLQAETYDGWAILGLARRANATLKLYAQSIPSLATCPGTTELATRLEDVATSARRQIGIVLDAGAAARPAPRQAMVGLVELLPEVVAISQDARTLAERFAIPLQAATVPAGATDPLGELAPLPTPGPTPTTATTAGIDPGFFGAGVRLDTYDVTGATPFEISASMNASGPYSEWTHSRVDGLTVAKATYRFEAFGNVATGGCELRSTGAPTIRIDYIVTLPRWTRPDGATSGTVAWWNDLVGRIAEHEKHHVGIYRTTERELNAAYQHATCATVEHDLVAVWNDTNRQQCEFDMKEYGYALDLSLADCVTP